MNHQTEYFKFYLFNGESYFSYWNRWEELDNFIFLYEDILAEIAVEVMLEKKFKTETLYIVSLEVYRNPDIPEEYYDYHRNIEKISQKKSLSEVTRTAKEVRNLGLTDCDLMADHLDELVKLIRSHK